MTGTKLSKEMMLHIAERNKKKAYRALEKTRFKSGVSEFELYNLKMKVQYAESVYDLIFTKYEE